MVSIHALLRAAAGAALLALAMPLAAAPAAVGPDVAKALASDGTARVLVLFQAGAKGGSGATDPAAVRAARRALLATLPKSGHRVRREFVRVPAVALEVDPAALAALADHPAVLRIDLDAGGTGALAESSPLASVSEVNVAGYLGQGLKVAVIDSGIDTDHPDFAGRVVAQQCFCSGPAGAAGCCPNGQDTQSGPGSAEDDHGHGSNVTGVLAGGGTVALRGAAAEATLVSVKVLDANNSFCCASDVVAALDWVLANHPDARVVNASLGTGARFGAACEQAAGAPAFVVALGTAVGNLVANGTAVVVSSGNNGDADRVQAPACVARAIAVGAVWDAPRQATTVLGCTDSAIAADLPTCFSNSGPALDLYAPGAPVTAAGRGGGTSTFFGTSQAAPLVAGCAAALRAANDRLGVEALAAALLASPTTVVDPKNARAYPRLDCADALERLGVTFANGFD